MGERGSGLRFWVVALLGGGAITACAGDTPPSDIDAPDLLKISVFYPVDGLVRGRGLPDTIRGGAGTRITHVRVASHPTKGETIVPIQSDGSFTFSVIAISDDLLEISAATDDKATERGEPVYIVVPPTPLPPPRFVCCGAQNGRKGTCQDEDSAAAGNDCPDAQTGTPECTIDRDCGALSGERLPLDLSNFQITPPDAMGRISITGSVQPDALITMENRGQASIGGYRPTARRQVRISEPNGSVTFENLPARGDDELVFQVNDLLGFRSPEGALLVPDSPLAGVDIIGAFAFAPLSPNQVGPVAILLQPYGIDGRGICPNSDEDPILCLSGGLTYDMVNLRNVDLEGPVTVTQTSTETTLPHTRGLLGGEDPLSGAQDIVIVFDMSADSMLVDDKKVRFDVAEDFVRGLRSRDTVALVTIGEMVEARTEFISPAQVAAVIDSLENETPEGDPKVFEAISFAAAMLREARSRRPGRIVVLTLTNEPGDVDEATAGFDQAFDDVRADPSQGTQGFTVDMVAIALEQPIEHQDLLSDIAAFTGGEFFNVLNLDQLNQTLADLRTVLSGSFILLYDMLIPEGVGKQGILNFNAEVVLPGSAPVNRDYSGPLTVLNGNDN